MAVTRSNIVHIMRSSVSMFSKKEFSVKYFSRRAQMVSLTEYKWFQLPNPTIIYDVC